MPLSILECSVEPDVWVVYRSGLSFSVSIAFVVHAKFLSRTIAGIDVCLVTAGAVASAIALITVDLVGEIS